VADEKEPEFSLSSGTRQPLASRLAGVRSVYGSLALLLYLSRLRSEAIVGRALAETFPTEADWEGFTQDPNTVEELSAFADVVLDMRSGQVSPSLTPQDVEAMAKPHLSRAMESVELMAEKLGIRTEDLIAALVTA
jgi:hypothetical protein